MNYRRVAVAAVAAWVFLGVSFVVRGVLLGDTYLQHASAMRPEGDANAILPIGFAFALAGFFAFAYAKGNEGRGGAQEGLRFGLLVGILLCCFGSIWDYMLWPMSTTLAAAWMIDFLLEFALYGIVVGLIYEPAAAVARKTVHV